MRASKFYLSTLKEPPQEAELVSHQLMIRAGFVKRLSSGLYTWMPLGLRVLKKIEKIIREEMTCAGAIEVLMPAIQPAELWQETNRWDQFGPQMLKIIDRHENEFCFGPTHEEVITDIARKEINSYKQLPLNFYQIQTKFRDEIRPRFGVMRAREFIMKDAYSFHSNESSLQEMYKKMYKAYADIFSRIELEFRPVSADSGSIGGEASHEFHVLAESGEDLIAFSDQSNYAANIELATTVFSTPSDEENLQSKKVLTKSIKSVEDLAAHFKCDVGKILKSLVFEADDNLVICFIAGDREINLVKLKKLLNTEKLNIAKDNLIQEAGLVPGFIGLDDRDKLKTIYDHSIKKMKNFITGSSENDYHYQDFNLAFSPEFSDISNVKEGDPSPDGKGILKFCRGIEVGHIFQLGQKYSKAMQATFLDEQGKSQLMTMGCYGIGVSRIIAAAIEQSNDENGMILPQSIAPFEIIIVPIGYHKNVKVKEVCLTIYEELKKNNIDVMLDDRDVRPGIMFAESDLMGVPHRIVIGEKSLELKEIEYKSRKAQNIEKISLDDSVDLIIKKLNKKNQSNNL